VTNTYFSVCAAVASIAIVVLAALGEAWIVVAVWTLLAVGFIARASERRWRGRR
jgi:hypothetical protein